MRLSLVAWSRLARHAPVVSGMAAMMGCLVRITGGASVRERACVEEILEATASSPALREQALAAFEAAQAEDFDQARALWQLQQALVWKPRLRRRVMYGLLEVAWAEGAPTPAQLEGLELMARRIGFSHARLVRLQERLARAGGMHPAFASGGLPAACALLGVSPGDGESVITRAYRRLVSEHHPDHLPASATATEVRAATERLQQIRDAYAVICQLRGF